MTPFPPDYDARVYAGWLGKCIGVRLGAPVEGWTYEEIRDNLGTIEGYLREAPGKVFKPDDDTAFPMILIRALEDNAASPDLSAGQIGEAWLNYLGDQQGTLWWGGYGVSTEHTAYVNLASGIPASHAGAMALNGAALAEQIGGQIFSDIWGLVAPGNPARAAELADRAASVSHDGNGRYGGRFIAAMVSHAFVEADPLRLIEQGLAFVPADSEYARVVRAVVDYYHRQPGDWHAGYAFLKAGFGYDRYPGPVHIIPNAGVIALALLYGAGDFSRAVRIATLAGWDTDCNAGNVGAIMGVAVGLEGIAHSWREPINDLLIAAGVIGTRNILTIPQCADLFCRLGRQMAGEAPQHRPRYHFQYPGSTNHFEARGVGGRVIHLSQAAVEGRGVLRAAMRKLDKKSEARLFTRTYYRPTALSSNYYGATFSPLIYPGQTATATLHLPPGAPDTLRAALYVYDDNHDQLHQGEAVPLTPGAWRTLSFRIPPLDGACLSEVGVVLRNEGAVWDAGMVALGELDWDGAPAYGIDFGCERPEHGGVSQWTRLRGYWRLDKDDAYHGSGPGLCESYSGDIRWGDYGFEAQLTPLFGAHHNINVRVQGALRSYAFGLAPEGKVCLYKKAGAYHMVAAADYPWRHGERVTLSVVAQGAALAARVQGAAGEQLLRWTDPEAPYVNGQIGLSVWHGSHAAFHSGRVFRP